jgi:hypothetical protein
MLQRANAIRESLKNPLKKPEKDQVMLVYIPARNGNL